MLVGATAAVAAFPLVHRLARLISSLAIDISEELVERLLPLGLFLRGVSEMEWEKKCA